MATTNEERGAWLLKYGKMVDSPEFQALEREIKRPNIFNVLKVAESELKHSNVLAWLLDPSGSHGLGDRFLRKFMRQVFSSERASDVDQLVASSIDLGRVEILREWRNIDILVKAQRLVVCIENKVNAKEARHQLAKYEHIVKSEFRDSHHVFVFLTPDGGDSVAGGQSFVPLSYQFIADAVDQLRESFEDSLSQRAQIYLKDYTQAIRRVIMQDDELTGLARSIYTAHREILDFVVANMPDETSLLADRVEKVLERRGMVLYSRSRGCVRFVTAEMDGLIPKGLHKWWSRGEAFALEIHVEAEKKRLQFKSVIPDISGRFDKNPLAEIVGAAHGARQPQGRVWLVHFSSKVSLDLDEMVDLSPSEQEAKLDSIVQKWLSTIDGISRSFVEGSDRLRAAYASSLSKRQS